MSSLLGTLDEGKINISEYIYKGKILMQRVNLEERRLSVDFIIVKRFFIQAFCDFLPRKNNNRSFGNV
ncbi:unnamed protein product [Larinioides sclopetarius]|uniref:Translation initiation factor 1 n=1 Tax=Larinioides sclopetarius TaxID=280406 RepID=A0AAV2BAF9_9ARAC